jgi:hypothetical protein
MPFVAHLPRHTGDHSLALANLGPRGYSRVNGAFLRSEMLRKDAAMTSFSWSSARWIAAALAVVLMAAPASAACRKLAFEVNDYGKEGPTKDALSLLDKHIAATMAKEGIKNFKVGKKSVDCKLFLDFIVFDEHTCTASANVCWSGPPAKPKN